MKWRVFGIALELDSDQLDDIEKRNKDYELKAMRMFELWLSTKPSTTRREIIETLKKKAIGQNVIADSYEKALKTKS